MPKEELETVSIEILEGCRATTWLTPLDFAAAIGLSAGVIPKGRSLSGGTILEITPGNLSINVCVNGMVDPVRVYAISRDGRFLLGLRTDFEKLAYIDKWWAKVCDVLDKRKDRQVTG